MQEVGRVKEREEGEEEGKVKERGEGEEEGKVNRGGYRISERGGHRI